MRAPLACIAVIAGVAMASPALAQDEQLYTAEMAEEALQDLGVEYEAYELDDGHQAFRFRFESGFIARLHLRACDEGQCRAISLYASWDDAQPSAEDLHRYHQNYVFGRVFMNGDALTVHRYLIADGGITKNNLVENLRVFGDLAPRIPTHIANLREAAEGAE